MKAIIFDFGGTLDTNGVHWSEFFWDVYQKFNAGISREEYERAYVKGENDMGKVEGSFRDILKKQLINQFRHLDSRLRGNDNRDVNDSSKLIEKMADYCYTEASNCLKKSKELLAELKKNFKLGVVSNFYGNMEEVCKEFGIFEYFDAVVDSTVVGVRKPYPKIFEITLKELNTEPKDTLVIGDSYENDIGPAKEVGCKTIWLRGRSWHEPEDISKADYVISSLEEIKKIVN